MKLHLNAKLLLLAVIVAITNGCSKQDLGAVATISAIAVAVPLVPFAEAYHLINDTEGKQQAQQQQWRQQFDPVYAERTQLILQRDPSLDAQLQFDQGVVVFLPTMPSTGVFPGLKYDPTMLSGNNGNTIVASPTLSTLQTLMADDPLHQQTAGWRYHSEIYDRFREVGTAYKVEFNQTMSHLSGHYQWATKQ